MRILRGIVLFIYVIIHLDICAQVHDPVVLQRLQYTCKVWGYLKYHHSHLCSGYVNWDSVLISSLDGIKNARTHDEFNDSLFLMIKKAGPLDEYIDYISYRGDSILRFQNDGWMQDRYLSDSIQSYIDTIKSIYLNQAQTYLYYNLGSKSFVQPFEADNQYCQGEDFPDENKRILAVYRYWNLIQYVYPLKLKIDLPWDTALAYYLPLVVNVKSAEQYNINFKKFTKSIQDARARYTSPVYEPYMGSRYLPIRVGYIEHKTLITQKINSIPSVSIGDEIIMMNGIYMEDYRNIYRELAEGTNQDAIERRVNEMIVRDSKSTVVVLIKTKTGDSIAVTLPCQASYWDSLEYATMNRRPWQDTMVESCKFSIIYPKNISIDMMDSMLGNISGSDAAIIDLRMGREYKFSFFHFLSYFSPKQINAFYEIKPNTSRPGEFYTNAAPFVIKPQPRYYDHPVILLVNETTIEDWEMVGLGLQQARNAIVIGSQTEGSGNIITYYGSVVQKDLISNAKVFLPGNIVTEFSLFEHLKANKEPFYRTGIKSNYSIKPTIKGIREGRDELMEYALQCKFAQAAVQNSKPNQSISVYPNPASDYLILSNTSKAIGQVTIRLLDMLGREISCPVQSRHNDEWRVDVSALTEGVYIITVLSSSTREIYQEKLVIRR